MKKHILSAIIFIGLLISLPGCEIIGTIFQTGVGVGVFIAVVILVVVIALSRKFRRR